MYRANKSQPKVLQDSLSCDDDNDEKEKVPIEGANQYGSVSVEDAMSGWRCDSFLWAHTVLWVV